MPKGIEWSDGSAGAIGSAAAALAAGGGAFAFGSGGGGGAYSVVLASGTCVVKRMAGAARSGARIRRTSVTQVARARGAAGKCMRE